MERVKDIEEKEERKKRYEQDRENHIKWNNERYAPFGLELIKSSDIEKLKKAKRKTFFKGVISSLIICIGILALAGAIFYGTYYDKFASQIFCNETLICGNATLKCGDTSNSNPCNVVCGNLSCEFPDEIVVILTNETD